MFAVKQRIREYFVCNEIFDVKRKFVKIKINYEKNVYVRETFIQIRNNQKSLIDSTIQQHKTLSLMSPIGSVSLTSKSPLKAWKNTQKCFKYVSFSAISQIK